MRFLVPLFAVLLLSAAVTEAQVIVDSIPGVVSLENKFVRLIITQAGSSCQEEYFAYDNGWHLILRSGSSVRDDMSLSCDRKPMIGQLKTLRVVEQAADSASVELEFAAEAQTITKRLKLKRDEKFVSVVVRDRISGVHEFSHLFSTYSFIPDGKNLQEYKRLDFVWTPQLRPDSSDVIGDHTFRSPALMMQKDKRFAALIPVVELIQPWHNIESAGDLQVTSGPAPFMSYGLMNWHPRSHVYYTHSDAMTMLLDNTTATYWFSLYVSANAEPRKGYRDVVRLHWSRTGRKHLLEQKGPQREPFAAYVRKAWKEYLPQVAVEATYNGKPVTLLTQERLAWSNGLSPSANTDCWFNVWFNALRTAYGMALHGLAINDDSLRRQAEQVLTLALQAPQKQGIAPCIFYLDSAGGHWVNDHGWGGIDGGRNFAMFHNAWTGVWLLRWADLVPARKREIIEYTTRFGNFLVDHQQPSGVIPSWYDPENLVPVSTFRDENAETAGAALFLAELYSRTQEMRYLKAAEHAMAYIASEIVPENKWYDFETFFSCSRKSVGFFDTFTAQHPQNTLSMHQAAEAYLSLYRITGRHDYRERGAAILDYLCLYQQVWSPPWLSCELFGGFGVQNTDGEWSDSRQGYFASTLMSYYELTGEREYFERAVAALRAMFSLFESSTSPRTWENYAHSAVDRPGGVTGIHWGTGSSVTTIHLLEPKYGGAFVNVAGGWGCGIDGCTISAVSLAGRQIGITIRDNVSTHRTLRITFGGLDGKSYTLTANERELGLFSSAELEKGIAFNL